MVLSGSFLIGGAADRKGRRKALARRMNFRRMPVCASRPVPQRRGSSRPLRGPRRWQSRAGSSRRGSEPWDHGFMTGWAGDMFLHPTTHFSAQRSSSLPPLSLPRARLCLICNLRVCPSPSSIIFSPFSPISLKNKLLPRSITLKLFSLLFKLLSNFSRTHLYSWHVSLPSFTAEIFIKLFFKPAGSFTSPFGFPNAAPNSAKPSLPPCAE